MNQISELIKDDHRIGIVNALQGDTDIHRNLLSVLYSPDSFPTLNCFEEEKDASDQPLLTDEMETYSAGADSLKSTAARFSIFADYFDAHVRNMNRFDRLVSGVASWIVKNNVNVIISPGQSMRDPNQRLMGCVVLRAAYRAAADLGQDILLLQLHPTTGFQGNWLAEAPPESDRDDTTYSRIIIKAPEVIDQNDEDDQSVDATSATVNKPASTRNMGEPADTMASVEDWVARTF
ncbi:MAG TPA: hypothetical protein VLG47_00645 [Candidatus Saccharimonadales bacterium]|nr:hypothetical protein [Candidatus Saccharimonadales bacterium]